MRRSPPGLSCLMGLDLRKRPLSDLTPEDEGQEAAPPPPRLPVAVVVHMAPAVEETPSFERTQRVASITPIACVKGNEPKKVF